MTGPEIRVRILVTGSSTPSYQTEEAAGLDLSSADQERCIPPGGRALIGTGIAVEIPSGYEGQIRPRSGLAWRHGIGIINSPGTIDSDYRGEIAVILVNHSDAPYTVRPGDRIAQLVIAPVVRASVQIVGSLTDTSRGSGGFGSTG